MVSIFSTSLCNTANCSILSHSVSIEAVAQHTEYFHRSMSRRGVLPRRVLLCATLEQLNDNQYRISWPLSALLISPDRIELVERFGFCRQNIRVVPIPPIDPSSSVRNLKRSVGEMQLCKARLGRLDHPIPRYN